MEEEMRTTPTRDLAPDRDEVPPDGLEISRNPEETRLLKDIVCVPVIQGDDVLIREILAAHKSEEYPTIVFEWNLEGLSHFIEKIRQRPAADAPAPPEAIEAPVQAVKGPAPYPADAADCILLFIKNLVPGVVRLGIESDLLAR